MNKKEVFAHPGPNNKQLEIDGKAFKSVNDWEITEEDVEKARVELGETNEKREKCLQELKERLSRDVGTNYRMDDSYLLRFLRFRKYNVDEACKNVKKFYDLKKKKPDFFTIPPNFRSLVEQNFMTCLPYVDEEGRILTFMDMEKWNPGENSFEEMVQCFTALYDVITANQKSQIHGIIMLCDAKGISMSQMASLLRKSRIPVFLNLVQNGYPYRFKKLVTFNTNPVMKMLYSIVRPMLRKKISERVFFLGSDLSELHQHVNPLLLQKKYGGSVDEEECNVTQNVMDNMPYLQYERSYF